MGDYNFIPFFHPINDSRGGNIFGILADVVFQRRGRPFHYIYQDYTFESNFKLRWCGDNCGDEDCVSHCGANSDFILNIYERMHVHTY